ncbi:hypothetical protein HN587_01760 [Candidatus Woesearchaeota archaeon]|nr:hypothetical protein [Candidatus Woesearchaeota archaeon]
MARKSLLFYVFISFFLFSVFAFFFPRVLAAPITIIPLAILFKYIIGTNWKDSFKLGAINWVWMAIMSIFVMMTELNFLIQGLNSPNIGVMWVFLVLVIGIPLTTIIINWKGNKHFDSSLFDKLSNNLSNKHNSSNKTHSHHKHKLAKKINKNSIKNFFIWFATFSVGIYIAIFSLEFFKLKSILVIVLLSGLIIEVVSKLMQIFVFDQRFIVNRRFAFWVFVQSISFLIGSTILSKIPSSFIISIIKEIKYVPIFNSIFVGLIITIIGHLVWKARIEKKIFN